MRITLNAALFAAGWTVFVLLADAWWQLVTAAYLAVVFTQTGFLGHDAGHRQIFRSRRANQWAGLHGDRRYRCQIQVAPVRVRGTRPAGDISSGLASRTGPGSDHLRGDRDVKQRPLEPPLT